MGRPLSLTEVLQLPEVQVGVGSTHEGETCPVCLELYRAGDEVSLSQTNEKIVTVFPWAKWACTVFTASSIYYLLLYVPNNYADGCSEGFDTLNFLF